MNFSFSPPPAFCLALTPPAVQATGKTLHLYSIYTVHCLCSKGINLWWWCFPRYTSKALLVYRNTTGKLLTDADIRNRLMSGSPANFMLDNIAVNAIGMNLHQPPVWCMSLTVSLLKQILKAYFDLQPKKHKVNCYGALHGLFELNFNAV